MNVAVKSYFSVSRPRGFQGRGDKYLPEIAQELGRVLRKTAHAFTRPVCRLQDGMWGEFAALVVEWAEDIHNDLGLWRAIETQQQKWFGTPLPLLIAPGQAETLTGFDSRRIQYLLWQLWPARDPACELSLLDPDLKQLAEAAGRFLTERMARVPQDSSVKHLLSGSNQYGWEIKRKLIWVGGNSYLFRGWLYQYLRENPDSEEVQATDFFLCERTTRWSGMGVIDVLAGALDLPETDRETLRSWHERHIAYYRVLTLQPYGTDQGIMTARNVVNQQVYTIRVYLPPTAKHPFKPGLVVYGTLVPWRGEWYWSGSQKIYEQISEQDEKDIRRSMLEELSSIAYRYCPEMAALARKYTRQLHEKFVQYYGTDLKVFPDGRTAAAMEGQRTDLLKIVPGAAGQEQAQGASEQDFGKPDDLFPPDFHNNTQGIAVFSQPEEEPEYMRDFNQLLSGMRKQGVDLSPDEASAVRGVMIAEVLSPALVRRVVAEHGPESILAAFQLHGAAPDVALEFLLRRYKGEFFRKRYPTLSLAGLDESLAKQSQAAGQSGVSAPSQPPA